MLQNFSSITIFSQYNAITIHHYVDTASYSTHVVSVSFYFYCQVTQTFIVYL